MVFPVQQTELSPTARAQLLAEANLNDAFKAGSFQVLNYASNDVSPYLKDYFLLVNDLKIGLVEETRRCYSDYCFVVFPVHKAFESYLSGLATKMFHLNISNKKGESLGFYLKNPPENMLKIVQDLTEKLKLRPSFDKPGWIKVWEALAREWAVNRNPLTHPDGEKMQTLRQAETAANSIIREMDVSAQFIVKEFVDPIIEHVKKEEEQRKSEAQQTP